MPLAVEVLTPERLHCLVICTFATPFGFIKIICLFCVNEIIVEPCILTMMFVEGLFYCNIDSKQWLCFALVVTTPEIDLSMKRWITQYPYVVF